MGMIVLVKPPITFFFDRQLFKGLLRGRPEPDIHVLMYFVPIYKDVCEDLNNIFVRICEQRVM